jgi:hypothetical protein
VTVDEIIIGGNIALGETPIAACPAIDVNKDNSVTVEEIITAVTKALGGCGTAALRSTH